MGKVKETLLVWLMVLLIAWDSIIQKLRGK
jgi:hypothetical protein